MAGLATRMSGPDGGGAVVLTSCLPHGGEARSQHGGDERWPFTVVRDRAPVLLPTRRVARRATGLLRDHGCDRVVLSMPLGPLARGLRAAGAREVIIVTGGREPRWARPPGLRVLLRRAVAGADVVTCPSVSARVWWERVLAADPRVRPARLAPGVDTDAFRPGRDGAEVREHYRLGEGPVVLTACRLVRRAGVDALIRAVTWLRIRHPGVRLVVAGEGPDEKRLRALAAWAGVADEVVFAGGRPHGGLPSLCAAADVFALPSRSPSGSGGPDTACLEAAASGLPVVVGSFGPAPEAVRHGETGFAVDGRDPREVADRIGLLLAHPKIARAMGELGRERVLREWTWEHMLSAVTRSP